MPRSVLVVDDDPSFRRLAAGLVRSWGHRVVGEAGSVAEAVAKVAELHPDTVLADVGLPDGDGLQLAETIGSRPAPPRVLLTSADPRTATDADARRAGAAGFIAKADIPGPQFRRMLDD
jgi:CheY-like chemotaxis protein